MAIRSMSLLFSFVIILLLHTNFILIASSQTVNDINGDFLQSGVEYFILPYARGTIGLSSNPNGSSCPSGIVLQTDITKHGLPVKFSNWNSNDIFFDEDASVNIEFSASSTCVTSTVWKLQPSVNGTTKRYFLTIGGVPGVEGINLFKIESSKSGGYVINYACPKVCPTCTPVCGPIGLINDNGRTRLGITSTPLRVSFVRNGL